MKFVHAVAFFGWFLKDAVRRPLQSNHRIIAGMPMMWPLAIIWFGYPAIIIPALAPPFPS